MHAEAEAAVRKELEGTCDPSSFTVTGPVVINQLRSWSVRVTCNDGTQRAYEYRKRIGSQIGLVWSVDG